MESEPSCPVFIACSISSASSPRTSPTMIRSGRIRRLAFIRLRIVTSPSPAVFLFLASSDTRLSILLICNSAESSIVIIRSPCGMKFDKAFKNVVFPDPVPPQIKILYFASTSNLNTSATFLFKEPYFKSCSIVIGVFENLRIVMTGPIKEIGGRTTLTRDPSSSLASCIGCA